MFMFIILPGMLKEVHTRFILVLMSVMIPIVPLQIFKSDFELLKNMTFVLYWSQTEGGRFVFDLKAFSVVFMFHLLYQLLGRL